MMKQKRMNNTSGQMKSVFPILFRAGSGPGAAGFSVICDEIMKKS